MSSGGFEYLLKRVRQELHLLVGPSPTIWHGAIQSVSTKPRSLPSGLHRFDKNRFTVLIDKLANLYMRQ
jgi:hypothetical protein